MYSAWAGTSRSTVSALTSSRGVLAEEAGDEILLDLRGGGDDGGEGGCGVGADSDTDLHAVAADPGDGLLVEGAQVGGGGGASGGEGHEVYRGRRIGCAGAEAVAELLGGVLLALPVHAGGLLVVDLHAVHADVALAGFGVPGDDAGEGDEGAAVLGPGGEDGEFGEVYGFTDMDDLLASGFALVDDFGEEAADLGEGGEEFEFVEEAGGCGGVEEGADAAGYVVEGGDIEGELHAGLGAELVHEDSCAGVADDVLEQ